MEKDSFPTTLLTSLTKLVLLKHLSCCILLIFLPIWGIAQVNIDSLWSVWHDETRLDTFRFKALYGVAYYGYLDSQPDSALYFAQMHQREAEKKDILYEKGRAHSLLGKVYIAKDQYDKAIENSTKALQIFKELHNIRQSIAVLNDIGNVYTNLNDYKKAIYYYHQCLDIQQDVEKKYAEAAIVNNIGLLFEKQGETEKALNYYERSLAIRQRDGSSPLNMVINLTNISNNYVLINELDKAFEKASEALSISQSNNYTLGIGMAYEALANWAVKKQEFSKARIYYTKSIDAARQVQNNRRLFFLLTQFGEFNIAQQKYQQGINLCKEALQIAERIEPFSLRQTACDCLYKGYKKVGNYDQALQNYEIVKTITDSLQNEENTQNLYREEYRFKTIQDSIENAAQLAIQISENKRRRNINYFLFGGLLLTLLLGGVIYNRFVVTRQQKKIIEVEKIKLDAANEKLQDLDKVKTNLYTNITHEFRTPLTVIAGLTDMMKGNDQNKNIIKSNTNQLLDLVNQMLDLRKIESGAMPLLLHQGDIIRFLSYLTDSFHSYAQSKKINLQFQAPDEAIIMDYDADKLGRIITNLLSNAIKFTPENGQISLGVKQVSAKQIEITVSDTGKGIPEEKLAYIFDQYYQVDTHLDSAIQSQSGTGIGLTIVKEFTKLMNGNIQVDSQVGKGTTFSLQLPISNLAPFNEEIETNSDSIITSTPIATDNATSTEEIVPQQTDLPSVLIIEDNADVAHYLKACLKNDYQLFFAQNGQEGIDQALERIPDLIVSDVMMPLRDGFDVCQTLKTDERSSHIPIVLLTGRADIESKLKGLSQGADVYLAKPFNKEELRLNLFNLLENRRKLQARYSNFQSSKKVAKKTIEDDFITKVRDIVIKNIDNDNFGIPQLCKALLMSRTQVHNKIKALTGKSTSLVVRMIRLQKAKEILETTELPITQVAYEVGFKHSSHFSRYFTEEFGVAPSQIRTN